MKNKTVKVKVLNNIFEKGSVFKAGEEIELSIERAETLARMGLVKVIKDLKQTAGEVVKEVEKPFKDKMVKRGKNK